MSRGIHAADDRTAAALSYDRMSIFCLTAINERSNDEFGIGSRMRMPARLSFRNCTNVGVTVLGATFKENVPDIRNSNMIDTGCERERLGTQSHDHDPPVWPTKPSAKRGGADSDFGIAIRRRRQS
jgi:UDP-N-acetyl-D-mannosaminuronate dehydrogenase